jgi:hypothetical protein
MNFIEYKTSFNLANEVLINIILNLIYEILSRVFFHTKVYF